MNEVEELQDQIALLYAKMQDMAKLCDPNEISKSVETFLEFEKEGGGDAFTSGNLTLGRDEDGNLYWELKGCPRVPINTIMTPPTKVVIARSAARNERSDAAI